MARLLLRYSVFLFDLLKLKQFACSVALEMRVVSVE